MVLRNLSLTAGVLCVLPPIRLWPLQNSHPQFWEGASGRQGKACFRRTKNGLQFMAPEATQPTCTPCFALTGTTSSKTSANFQNGRLYKKTDF